MQQRIKACVTKLFYLSRIVIISPFFHALTQALTLYDEKIFRKTEKFDQKMKHL